MKQIASGPLARAAGAYAEHAPVATACCNACRTCVQTNLIALAAGGAIALATGFRRLAQRMRV